MTEFSDYAAVQRYLNGDADALAPLVEKYRRPLYGFILQMNEGRLDPDEIFQETWFRALKNLHRFRKNNFPAWLMRIARNLMLDRIRKRKKQVSLQDAGGEGGTQSALQERLPAPGLNPADGANGNALGAAIEEALRRLPPEQREVFVLRMQSGLAFREIARIQGCSINTSLARMQYALARMRSMLEKEYRELQEDS